MTSQSSKSKSRVVLFIIVLLPTMIYVLINIGKHNMIYLPEVVLINDSFQVDRDDKAFHDSLNYGLVFPEVTYTNLETKTKANLKQLESRIYAIQFLDMDSLSELDLALFYKAETQLAERLMEHEEIQLLSFWCSKNADYLYQQAKSITQKQKFSSWKHVSVDSKTFDYIKRQAFIEPVRKRALDNQRLFTIIDRNHEFRAGIDKHNKEKYLFCYDVGREYEIKLLLEDLKVLYAEEFKALKSKK